MLAQVSILSTLAKLSGSLTMKSAEYPHIGAKQFHIYRTTIIYIVFLHHYMYVQYLTSLIVCISTKTIKTLIIDFQLEFQLALTFNICVAAALHRSTEMAMCIVIPMCASSWQ